MEDIAIYIKVDLFFKNEEFIVSMIDSFKFIIVLKKDEIIIASRILIKELIAI